MSSRIMAQDDEGGRVNGRMLHCGALVVVGILALVWPAWPGEQEDRVRDVEDDLSRGSWNRISTSERDGSALAPKWDAFAGYIPLRDHIRG